MASDGGRAAFQICIPTRDSARWIIPFLAAYRNLGVEPLYVVDARSVDETLSLLRDAGANVVLFEPKGNFVEAGMIEFAARSASADWVLRLDDDEFPSRELLRWASDRSRGKDAAVWALSRRSLICDGGAVRFSRWWGYYNVPSRPDFSDGQLRFFRRGEVEYIQEIHTPGFRVASFEFAPQQAYFAHFDALLRGMDERIEKLRRYEVVASGSGWRFGYHSLPELLPMREHDPAALATDEFDRLLGSLPLAPETDDVTLRVEELRAIRDFVELERQRRLRSSEGFANKLLAEALCSLARALAPFAENSRLLSAPVEQLRRNGTVMWERAAAKSRRQPAG